LYARTALRILVPIKKFSASNEQQLYDEVKKINWDEYMDANDTLSVEASSNSDFFNHTKYIALKTKDAIVDLFIEKYGVRHNVDLEQPILKLNLHIFQNECTLSLDSSGESLHRRGYRADANLAPLNEVTAAALIIHSGWNGEGYFVDGMCGSGTILIEAAMFANIDDDASLDIIAFVSDDSQANITIGNINIQATAVRESEEWQSDAYASIMTDVDQDDEEEDDTEIDVNARAYGGTATVTISNAPNSPIGFGFTLVTVNAGAYAITWPASVDWVGGSAPILTSSGTDVLVFYTYDGGTTYYGFVTGKNLS
jgi:hypothetical protein